MFDALLHRRTVRRLSIFGLLAALAPAVAAADPHGGTEVGNTYQLSRLGPPASNLWQAFDRDQVRSAPRRTVEALEALFARLDYRLDSVRERGVVPRLLVREMPGDLSELRDAERRKAVFIRIALPLILATNEMILRDRARIERLRAARDNGALLPLRETVWLLGIFDAYGLERPDFDELLRRVDIIPPSLAVAQAAEETGWGTSRFVRRGNALFGERIYRGTDGMVPRRIEPGSGFRVRRFGALLAAVDAYAANLNTHPAYAAFRSERNAMRAAKSRLDAAELAGGLAAYSERRQAYIKTVRAIIRTNALTGFDHLRLDSSIPQYAMAPASDAGRLSN